MQDTIKACVAETVNVVEFCQISRKEGEDNEEDEHIFLSHTPFLVWW
jgi:hypothetical protein